MTQPDPSQSRPPEETQRPYTLRIVFSGILPLIREPADGSERLWVLVSNLKDPSSLPPLPGHLIPKSHDCCNSHVNRLLVPTGCFRSVGTNRTIHGDAEVCRETGTFDYVELQNEHLNLEPQGNWEPLNVIEGRIDPPIPCVPGTSGKLGPCNATGTIQEQEEDFGWVLDVDKILVASTKPKLTPPKLQESLFDDSYTTHDPRYSPLLSARMVFDRGSLTTRTLDRDSTGRYRIYRVRNFDGKPLILRQTIATQVQITLQARGPIVFQARALNDHTSPLDSIVIENVDDRDELTVFVDNQPADLDCARPDLGGQHFHLNHHLLDYPARLRALRVPEFVGTGPVLNAQCSPPLYSKP